MGGIRVVTGDDTGVDAPTNPFDEQLADRRGGVHLRHAGENR